MKVGDLVRCIMRPCDYVDGGVGIVIKIDEHDPESFHPQGICVQWERESLWYEERDLEVINEGS